MKLATVLTTSCFVVLAAAISAAEEKPACALLTQAQVSTALGTSVDAGKPIARPGTCQWFGKGKFATLTITQPRGGKSAVDQFTAGKKGMPGITVEPVSSVGDEAYYVYFAGTDRAGLGLVVKRGMSAFEVRVYGFVVAEAKTVAKTLAQEAAGKI
jgi:hypothetical protein